MQKIPAQITSPSLLLERNEDAASSNKPQDMPEYLSSFGLQFSPSGYYFLVGELQKTQGWILHLSVILSQLPELLDLVLPTLIKQNIPFKIPQSRSIALQLINGDHGPFHLAKVICIYPDTDEIGGQLATWLINHTKHIKGPAIPTDFCLGNIVFTRYGAFSPVWTSDHKGRPTKCIYDHKGDLVKDLYDIPFRFPEATNWPFQHISLPALPPKAKLINRKYYPISTLRDVPRGSVVKAIYFKHLWDIKACVLKQGRNNMGSDDLDRTVADRLKWQYKLCRHLKGIIPLPKVFDYFIEDNDTYLAMEYVKGDALDEWLSSIYCNRIWSDLPSEIQNRVIKILIQLTDIIHSLHDQHLIHRDITPGNFLVTKNDQVIPIDLELAWPTHSSNSLPPFQLGTPGYMSPQQEREDIPSFKDDIFGLGAVFVGAFTNQNRSAIPGTSSPRLRAAVYFLTQSEKVCDLIIDCLQEDPTKRPTLEIVRTTLHSNHLQNKVPLPTYDQDIDQEELIHIIQSALDGLSHPKLLNSSGCWRCCWDVKDPRLSSEQANAPYPGWQTGLSGPLWLIAWSKLAGFDVSKCTEIYIRSWDAILASHFQSPDGSNKSLFYGHAGMSLALTEGIRSTLLSSGNYGPSLLHGCFSERSKDFSISEGLSGQGLALLYLMNRAETFDMQLFLRSYVDQIVCSQLADGSWPLEATRHKQSLSLFNGSSGIIWFLLSYLQHTSDHNIRVATEKALNRFLSTKTIKTTWKHLKNRNSSHAWFSTKLAIDSTKLMIKAYEVLGDPQYKRFAEVNLSTLPEHVLLRDQSLDKGTARLGQLYLQASRILDNSLWQERASWITNLLLQTSIQRASGSVHWPLPDADNITADLCKGNSGIICFLINYLQNVKQSLKSDLHQILDLF